MAGRITSVIHLGRRPRHDYLSRSGLLRDRLVEYTEQMHSDLPTMLRGYVQLDQSCPGSHYALGRRHFAVDRRTTWGLRS